MSLAWWNGRLVEPEQVRIAPDDAGFLFGDGLFETLRVDAGRARHLSAHLDRLFAGLQRLSIAPPEDRCSLGRVVTDIASSAPRPVARLRITVSRGTEQAPTRLITTSLYEPPSEDVYRRGVAAILIPEIRIDSRGPLAGLKSLCYQPNRLALRLAEARGAWDALRLNEHGRLVAGSRSNLALVLPDGIFTPPESEGCLPGTVRRRLLEAGAIHERPLTFEDLAAASGLLLMNSLVGVLPVASVDGREIPVGPEASQLRTFTA
ncbi:MAG TPA: aminotransferase class IV [Thermoanaerobaculia bacterium]|jgi:branched-subunit amino acid aminotransferase/4-amino-4-deoxychorismate lyase